MEFLHISLSKIKIFAESNKNNNNQCQTTESILRRADKIHLVPTPSSFLVSYNITLLIKGLSHRNIFFFVLEPPYSVLNTLAS